MHRVIQATLAAAMVAVSAFAAGAADEAGLKGRAEASYVRTTGNTDAQTLAGKLGGSYIEGVNRYFLKSGVLFAKSDGDETSNRWLIEGRYERGLSDRLFAFAELDYLKDKFSGYDSKIQFGPGVGYEFIKTDRHFLKGLASLLYTWDNYTDGGTDSYATAKLAGDYTWQIQENLKFRQYADYQVSLKDTNVFFVNSETALEVKVATNISLGLSYLIAYQNDPPGDAKHNDRTFLTSLIVDF
jgi:putative salt-induced outer membrane protein